MAQGETPITVVGNLVADPELRHTPSGVAVANFRVASTPRNYDKNTNQWVDGDPLFMACNVWRQAAENVANSLGKGDRVIVNGRLRQRSFENREGEKRTVIELEVDEVGPALKYATAQVAKAAPNRGGQPQQPAQQGGFNQPAQQQQRNDDPWNSAPQGTQQQGFGGDSEPPF